MGVATPALLFRLVLVLWVAVLSSLGVRTAEAKAATDVPVLEIRGVINPLSARYLSRELTAAARQKAPLVLVEIDTPGGTMDAMREMVQEIMSSAVPVAVYVAPAGAHAASAGMFVVGSGHVAAMAPGTSIGSAHPVVLLAPGPEQDSVMADKVVNDAAATARAIAAARGRNATWYDSAVRKSVSLTAEEALAQNVVDVVATDRAALLRAIDGRSVETRAGPALLRTQGIRLVERSMTLPERLLYAVTDPNIAYLLFSLGLLGLFVELLAPGHLFPGLAGGICLVLSLVAFGSLPVNWAGALLVLVGIALVVADALTAGLGLVSVGGLVAFLFGSLLLYRPLREVTPAMPRLHVSLWLVAVVAVVFTAFAFSVVRGVMLARRLPVQTGVQSLLGESGRAISDVNPKGTVWVHGEAWSAVTDEPPIQSGESVKVSAVEGVILRVRRAGGA